LRQYLGSTFRDLATQRESKVLEGHLRSDHVHMLISIPPKYAVAQVIGFIKGESAIHIARNFMGHRKNFTGQHFWARGYYVSTVGQNETTIRLIFNSCKNIVIYYRAHRYPETVLGTTFCMCSLKIG